MSKPNKGAVKKAPFNPNDLTLQEQALVVKEFLGVHPDFFIYKGTEIKINLGKYRNYYRDSGEYWNGWKPSKAH